MQYEIEISTHWFLDRNGVTRYELCWKHLEYVEIRWQVNLPVTLCSFLGQHYINLRPWYVAVILSLYLFVLIDINMKETHNIFYGHFWYKFLSFWCLKSAVFVHFYRVKELGPGGPVEGKPAEIMPPAGNYGALSPQNSDLALLHQTNVSHVLCLSSWLLKTFQSTLVNSKVNKTLKQKADYLTINSVRTNGPTLCLLVWIPYAPESVEKSLLYMYRQYPPLALDLEIHPIWDYISGRPPSEINRTDDSILKIIAFYVFKFL